MCYTSIHIQYFYHIYMDAERSVSYLFLLGVTGTSYRLFWSTKTPATSGVLGAVVTLWRTSNTILQPLRILKRMRQHVVCIWVGTI